MLAAFSVERGTWYMFSNLHEIVFANLSVCAYVYLLYVVLPFQSRVAAANHRGTSDLHKALDDKYPGLEKALRGNRLKLDLTTLPKVADSDNSARRKWASKMFDDAVAAGIYNRDSTAPPRTPNAAAGMTTTVGARLIVQPNPYRIN